MTVQKGGWDFFQEGNAAMGDASGNPVTDSSGNPAANMVIREKFAGEEDQTSEFDSRLRVTDDWKHLRYDLSGGTVVVYDGPCRLGGIFVEVVLSAHVVDLHDDTTSVIELPASTAALTEITALKGTRISTRLRIVPNASSTGIIIVQYREAEFS